MNCAARRSKDWAKVLGGAAAIVIGACVLAYATQQHVSGGSPRNATLGVLAALGAGLLWGTMYIPYRKAYISGMNPLSFVTIFTFGELGTVLRSGRSSSRAAWHNLWAELGQARPALVLAVPRAASAGSSATCSSNTPPSTSASAAASRFPIPTSFGAWRGARWSSASCPAWTRARAGWWSAVRSS